MFVRGSVRPDTFLSYRDNNYLDLASALKGEQSLRSSQFHFMIYKNYYLVFSFESNSI